MKSIHFLSVEHRVTQFETISTALVLMITLFTPTRTARATTYLVDDDWRIGSPPYAEDLDADTQFATIQAALDAASVGDTINVAAGTYYENITLKDGVDLLGAGPTATTIDGGGIDRVVTAVNIGAGTRLEAGVQWRWYGQPEFLGSGERCRLHRQLR